MRTDYQTERGNKISQDNNARCAPVAHRCTVATLLHIKVTPREEHVGGTHPAPSAPSNRGTRPEV
jgi:hypothetical protein